MRSLRLVGAPSYSSGDQHLLRGQELRVESWAEMKAARRTGLFAPDPPLQLDWVEYTGALRSIEVRGADETYRLCPGVPHRFDSQTLRTLAWGRLPWQKWSVVQAIEHFLFHRETCSLLFCRDMGLGDLLMSLPALAELKRRYGTALKIVYATLPHHREVIGWCPHVDEVTNIREVTAFDYTVSFDAIDGVEGWPRNTTLHRTDYFAELLGLVTLGEKVGQLQVPCELAQASDREFRKDSRKLVAFQPWGTAGIRSWPTEYVEQFLDLMQRQAPGIKFLLLHSEHVEVGSRRNCENLSGRLTEEEFVATIKISNFFLGTDSGGYHVAATDGNYPPVPSLVLFGSIHEDLRTRYYEDCFSLRTTELSCSPCWDFGCAGVPCMKQLDPELVARKLLQLMSGRLEKPGLIQLGMRAY